MRYKILTGLTIVIAQYLIREVEHMSSHNIEPKAKKARLDEDALLNNFPMGIVECEIKFKSNDEPSGYVITKANPQFSNIADMTLDTLIGKQILDVIPSQRTVIEKYVHSAVNGESNDIELFSRFPEKFYSMKIYKVDTNKYGLVFNDVTEYQKAKHNLEIVNTALEVTNLTLGHINT
jgi:nitrogen fixation/metabolism regulation signal transduction histidine kinase